MYITLDSIIRNVLLNTRRPVHYYLEYLNHGKDCLRELNFDVLKCVNSVIIPLNSYKAAPLPCDYVDFTKVGFPIGQYIRPLMQYDKISRLNNFDSTGNKIPYGTGLPDSIDNTSYLTPLIRNVSWTFMDNGRWYGFGTGRERDVFKIIKERKEIQMDEHFTGTSIVLEYMTDGSSCDAATQVDPYAQAAIEQYIIWKTKKYNRNSGIGEVRDEERLFTKERDTLLARLSDVTIEDVKRAYRRAYYGAMKH